jgi:hemerythrin-like domain-containing protein
MKEHRLIELMIKNIETKLSSKQAFNRPVFAETVLDFFRTYADRCHHGKEEDILFRELSKKPLSEQHRRIMNELIQEHCIARKTVARLEEAKNKNSQTELRLVLSELIGLYPPHIEKEDKRFFFPVMEYFSPQELDAMIHEFKEFDEKMIHEKYEKLVKFL